MAEITRRSFIQTCGMAAIGVGLASGVVGQTRSVSSPGELFPIPPESMSDPLTYLTSGQFEPFVGSVFTGVGAGRGVSFRLRAVNDRSAESGRKGVVTGPDYSLMFETNGRRSLQSGSYVFDHPSLGKFTLLVSPVNLGNAQYEAVINRVNAPAGKRG